MADVVDPTGEAAAGTMVGEGPGTGGDDFSQFVAGSKQQPQPQFDSSGDINVMSEWVPGEIPTHATQYGPDERHLVYGVSAAVSPNLSAGHDLHEPFEVYDPQGNLVGTYSYDDHSYYSPGNPTYNSIERYGLPALGRGYSIKWLGQGANDFSQYVAQPKEEEEESDFSKYVAGANVPRGTSEESDFSKYVAKPKEEAKSSGRNLGNEIMDAWLNLFGQGSESASKLDAQAALDDLNRVKSGVGRGGMFEPVRKSQDDEILADPNRPQEEKDNIRAQRQAQLQSELAAAQSEYDRKTKAAGEAEWVSPGQEYQKTIPGKITKWAGQAAPWLASGALGPLAPLGVATQMTSSAYGEQYEKDSAKLKEIHPDWTDDQIRKTADKSAREASQFSFETGIVTGLLPTPKIGPLIARLVERVGIRGTYMVIAGASQDIQSNLATRKYVDPNQAIYDGVLAQVPENFFSGAAFEIPGAVGEVLGSRRAQTGEQPVTKTLEVEQPKVEGLSEKKSLKAAIRIKDTGQILTGGIHAEAYTNAGLDPGQFKEGEVEDGWVDENGKFLTYKEGAKRQEITALKPGEKVPEQQEFQFTPVTSSDQWISGIRNKSVEERAARGELDQPQPGAHYSTEELVAMGQRMPQEQADQHIADLMNKPLEATIQQAAAVRAREAQLAARSNQLSRISDDDPGNLEKKAAADQARDSLNQFHA